MGNALRGKWRIDARLGDGSTAQVWAATHVNNGFRVALKVLHPDLSRDPEMRARFLREGYVANTIQHPGVVRVIDDDAGEDGCVFLVMDLLEGESLASMAERLGGTVPAATLLPIVDGVLDVLAAAHAQEVVHRDVKPDNIFVPIVGPPKVLDFGLARMKEGSSDATRTGLILGTPDYMAPEQARGKRGDVDARSDVFAVGATLFTLLSGQALHFARTLPEHLQLVASTRPRSLSVAAPSVDRAIVAVVDRALALEREERWQSAREMQVALRAAMGGTTLESDGKPDSGSAVTQARGSELFLAGEPPVPSSAPPPSGVTTQMVIAAPGAAATRNAAPIAAAYGTGERPRASDTLMSRVEPATSGELPPSTERTPPTGTDTPSDVGATTTSPEFRPLAIEEATLRGPPPVPLETLHALGLGPGAQGALPAVGAETLIQPLGEVPREIEHVLNQATEPPAVAPAAGASPAVVPPRSGPFGTVARTIVALIVIVSLVLVVAVPLVRRLRTANGGPAPTQPK